MISLNCPYCGLNFLTATPALDQPVDTFVAAWKRAAVGSVASCDGCSGTFRVIDDVSPGGSIALTSISRPRIDSLSVASGPRTGGTAVFIQGEALDIGTLTVRFGPVAAPTVDSRTHTTARVVTPPGIYALFVSEYCAKIVLAPVLGSFSVGETVTAASGSTGIVRAISGAQHFVYFSTLIESASELVGVYVSGSSGAVATVSAASLPIFQEGEQLHGHASAAVATVLSIAPLVVGAPTAGFSPGELVQGATSGATVKLDPTTPYSGLVDISVENEYGRRESGGTLAGAFTFA